MFRRYLVTLIALLTINLISKCTGGTDENRQTDPVTIEHQMAVVDEGSYVPESDPSVVEFRDLLNRISPKIIENEQQIGDMVAKTRDMLKEKGITVSLMSIMVGINDALSVSNGKQKLNVMLGTYCSFRTGGKSHTESMAMLKGLSKTGIFE